MAFPLCLCAISYFLLVLFNGVFQVKGGNNHDKAFFCPPSSCGHLHDIHDPFRFKTDPPLCGLTQFELLCDTNKPYIYWQSGKFYVMSISYQDQVINVIDPALVNGTCNPATSSLGSRLDFHRPLGFCNRLESLNGVSFVSCSSRVAKSRYYAGCRTDNNTSLYVLDVYEQWRFLEPSCRRLSSTYISKYFRNMKSKEEVFDTLRKGFKLCWFKKSSKEEVFHEGPGILLPRGNKVSIARELNFFYLDKK
ncbi:Wall-associated receptor kinase galacturonan-binding [Carex littledalei]|uniref:Wall-associated receptor kinase galacturonan-binding n=1 Tax=Carex littledalei TaxID=544730 RepID=A0A833RAK8_9POAL|nr:Wall-associated receptor kinase galacturonan-binding [Carex littledalei]